MRRFLIIYPLPKGVLRSCYTSFIICIYIKNVWMELLGKKMIKWWHKNKFDWSWITHQTKLRIANIPGVIQMLQVLLFVAFYRIIFRIPNLEKSISIFNEKLSEFFLRICFKTLTCSFKLKILEFEMEKPIFSRVVFIY